eukprot:scaffold11139_cov91-Skeletonema_dohrnii-CCMP3373.AAC.3
MGDNDPQCKTRDKPQSQAEVLQLYTKYLPPLFEKRGGSRDLQLSSRRATSSNKYPAESYPNHEVVQGSCSSIQFSECAVIHQRDRIFEKALLSGQTMVAVRQTLSLPIHEEGGGVVGSAHNL